MVVIGLLLGALLSPLYITVLLGAEVNVPIFKIFTQIFIVVFIPLILAFLTQVILKKKLRLLGYLLVLLILLLLLSRCINLKSSQVLRFF